jgi:hypothetical protein
VLPYLHPAVGVVVLALLVGVGSLGLRARTLPRRRHELLVRHARLAPIAYALVGLTWLAGVLSTLLLRADLSIATSLHFRSGALIVLLMTGSAISARAMRHGNRTARGIHPWLGAGAILLAAAQVATGLRIMP